MEFDRRNREALVNALKEENEKLDIANRVLESMEKERSTKDVLWQVVFIRAQEATIKIIEKSLIDNHPFDLDLDF
jgi:hypothetical protein